jgi:hypothetical protein
VKYFWSPKTCCSRYKAVRASVRSSTLWLMQMFHPGWRYWCEPRPQVCGLPDSGNSQNTRPSRRIVNHNFLCWSTNTDELSAVLSGWPYSHEVLTPNKSSGIISCWYFKEWCPLHVTDNVHVCFYMQSYRGLRNAKSFAPRFVRRPSLTSFFYATGLLSIRGLGGMFCPSSDSKRASVGAELLSQNVGSSTFWYNCS